MNELESLNAVGQKMRVQLRWGAGDGHGAEGHVIAYSIHPQILIETDDGERIWWRADMADLVP